jgi:RNA polymerase subunit RPABC4/transcription elongation factor Spt4
MDALDRLHRRLRDALERTSPGTPAPSASIADIYQQLVPYRLVRTEMGFSELKEYEHALLRLLAGERGYLKLESEEAAEDFRRELASPNPILGVYRDYATVGATVHPGSAADATDPLPAAPSVAAPEPPATNVPNHAAPPYPEPSAPPSPGPACRSCRETLPGGRSVRFCPSCGTAQVPVACIGCGTLLEPEWRFCIQCGLRSGEAGVPRA